MFLKFVIYILALAALAFCIFAIPSIIGSVDLGGYDPVLIGMYLPAIPFFIALYQALKLLNYIDENKAFSGLSVKALSHIKHCGISISAMYLVGLPYIFMVADQDDAPGVVAITFVIIFASFVIAIFAAVLQSLLKSAIEIKTENDLTV